MFLIELVSWWEIQLQLKMPLGRYFFFIYIKKLLFVVSTDARNKSDGVAGTKMVCFNTDISLCNVCHLIVIGNVACISHDLVRHPFAVRYASSFSALLY